MLDVLIIGAGASGCFTALRLKEEDPSLRVAILERQSNPLQKVKISGGGRCNVTHNSDDLPFLLQHYPRQHKQVKGQLNAFPPSHMRQWLKDRGVETVVEADGRVFPKSQASQEIIDVFLSELKRHRVTIHFNQTAVSATWATDENAFKVETQHQQCFHAQRVVLASGSQEQGYQLAQGLGLRLTPLVPSLFTFCVKDSRLHACAGLSVEEVSLTLKVPDAPKPFKQRGALLLTHWGVSGPAVLKLSARSAVELKASNYRATLFVDALSTQRQDATRLALESIQMEHPKRDVKNIKPHDALPWRYWHLILAQFNIDLDKKWGELSKKELNQMVEGIHHLPLQVEGKGVFKEEFVTAGGVEANDLHLKHLEAKHQRHLYVVGELLNVDGMTGGFNFQHCWASANAVALGITASF